MKWSRLLGTLLLVVVSSLHCLDCFAQNKTIILGLSGLPYQNQTWFYSGDNNLEEANIKKYWNDSYRITSVAYTKNGWFVSMSKASGITLQYYQYSKEFPKNFIRQKWGEDYYITSVASSRTHWLVVMSKGVGYTDQLYKQGQLSSVISWYKEKKAQGFFVTAADYTGTEWWIVMSKGSDIVSQSHLVATSYDDLLAKIKQSVWGNGYSIHLIEYGADGYLVFYGKLKNNGKHNQFSVNPTSPKESIQKMWDVKDNVAYIGGGYESSQSSSTSTSTTSGHGLPYNEETKYWKSKDYDYYIQLRGFKDSYGEVIYEKNGSLFIPWAGAGISSLVYKKESISNGYYVLQKCRRTIYQTGFLQYGNDEYTKLDGTIKVSLDGSKVIDEEGKIFNKEITKEEATEMSRRLRRAVGNTYYGGSAPSSSSSSGATGSGHDYGRCTQCGGTGACSSCRGQGVKYNPYGGGYTECPSCRGNGRCFNCYGKGRID